MAKGIIKIFQHKKNCISHHGIKSLSEVSFLLSLVGFCVAFPSYFVCPCWNFNIVEFGGVSPETPGSVELGQWVEMAMVVRSGHGCQCVWIRGIWGNKHSLPILTQRRPQSSQPGHQGAWNCSWFGIFAEIVSQAVELFIGSPMGVGCGCGCQAFSMAGTTPTCVPMNLNCLGCFSFEISRGLEEVGQ